jgi:hypothetical protein
MLRLRSPRDVAQFENAFLCPFSYVFQATQLLDDVAQRLGVTQPSAFYAMDPDEAAEMLEEIGLDASSVPQIAWHSVDDGLKTVAALEANLDSLDCTPEYREELRTELGILKPLLAHVTGTGATFYFHMDF